MKNFGRCVAISSNFEVFCREENSKLRLDFGVVLARTNDASSEKRNSLTLFRGRQMMCGEKQDHMLFASTFGSEGTLTVSLDSCREITAFAVRTQSSVAQG